MSLHALRPIATNEEITISYGQPLFATRAERRSYLKRTRGFDCTCGACRSTDPSSDARREELKRLFTGIPFVPDPATGVKMVRIPLRTIIHAISHVRPLSLILHMYRCFKRSKHYEPKASTCVPMSWHTMQPNSALLPRTSSTVVSGCSTPTIINAGRAAWSLKQRNSSQVSPEPVSGGPAGKPQSTNDTVGTSGLAAICDGFLPFSRPISGHLGYLEHMPFHTETLSLYFSHWSIVVSFHALHTIIHALIFVSWASRRVVSSLITSCGWARTEILGAYL
jgi:hypothetical protein